MAYTLATGSTLSIAKTYGASITVTAATNSVSAGYNATTTLTTPLNIATLPNVRCIPPPVSVLPANDVPRPAALTL